jgi:hypothetical protein
MNKPLLKKQETPAEDYYLNQIEFNHFADSIEIGLGRTEEPGSVLVHILDLPENLQKLFPEIKAKNGRVQVQFGEITHKLRHKVKLADYPRLAGKYYGWHLRNLLIRHNIFYQQNFVGDLVVWTSPEKKVKYAQFDRINLKVIYDKGDQLPSIRVSYLGQSFILLKDLKTIGLQMPHLIEYVKQVVYNRQITSMKRLSPEDLAHEEKIYPVMNLKLAQGLNIEMPFRLDLKKFETNKNRIDAFIKSVLYKEPFNELFTFKPHWKKLNSDQVGQLENDNRVFLFGKNQPGSDLQNGLLKFGPYRPVPTKQITAFFIYHESEKLLRDQVADKLVVKPGQKGLGEYIHTPVFPDPDFDIVYNDSGKPLVEIFEKIRLSDFAHDISYLAIYLSPYDSFEQAPDKHRLYYQIKEALLQRGIASQTLDMEKVKQAGNNFRYWMPNLAMAAIAKLGGVPWALPAPESNDLVVGFGLKTTTKYNMRMVGSSVCFTSDGQFKEFNFFPENEGFMVVASLEKALKKYLSQNQNINRLVIHYYKDMSKKDFKPILEMIDRLKPGVPVVVININTDRTETWLVKHDNHNGEYPANGTFFHLMHQQYLLYINDNLAGHPPLRFMPMPIRLGIQCSDRALLDDEKVVNELLGQVYSFSFLYWRSVRQPNVPVTVGFPRMLASQAAWFDRQVVPEGANGLPFFL